MARARIPADLHPFAQHEDRREGTQMNRSVVPDGSTFAVSVAGPNTARGRVTWG